MKNNGLNIYYITKLCSGKIISNVKVAMESSWFDGHFPKDPVLPGIALLSLVYQIINKALNLKIQIYSFSRVRFKQIVRPGDDLEFIIEHDKKTSKRYSFQVKCKKESVLTGFMNIS